MNITWLLKQFHELSPAELYDLLAAREAVFVIEQNCIYNDLDGLDAISFHLLGYDADTKKLAAYLRILPPGAAYSEPSIGRVLTTKNYRGTGLGKILMEEGHHAVEKLFPGSSIHIGAQLYLKDFYESFGYQQVTDPYDLDGIQHIGMIKES